MKWNKKFRVVNNLKHKNKTQMTQYKNIKGEIHG